jgi:hypothetical protein
MDLQKILSHRETCFICQEKLVYSIFDYPNLFFLTDDKGFHIRSGHKQGIRMDFNFDSIYQRNKRNYTIYQKAINIVKKCLNCCRDVNNFPSYPSTSLSNIKNKEYAYNFTFHLHPNNIYSARLGWETARYHDDQQFFHVDSYYPTNRGELHHATFDKKIEGIFSLDLPNVINLSKVNNVNDYIKKCTTIINFS